MKQQYFFYLILTILQSSLLFPSLATATSKADIVVFFSNTVLGETEPCG